MREILFRAKRVKKYCATQDWTYGVPFIDHEGDCIFKTSASEYVVDPETVGQYTGMTDKNGTKIFEGDIIKSCEYDDIYVVEYCDEHNYPAFDVLPEIASIECNGLSYLHNVEGIEVIGNIHDNPELLEGGVR